MKKRISLSLFVLTALVTALIAGGCNLNNPVIDDWWIGETPKTLRGPVPITTYTVTFDMVDDDAEYFDAVNDNSDTIKPQVLKEGALASEPGLVIIDASDDNHHDIPASKFFDGWYTAETGGNPWVFSTNRANQTSDMIDGKPDGIIPLYARWESIGYTVIFHPGKDLDGDLDIDDDDFVKTVYKPEPEYVTSNTELSQPKGFGLKPDDPLADDYVFTGWYTIVNDVPDVVNKGDTKWNFAEDRVTSDKVTGGGELHLYAGWGVKTAGGGFVPPENLDPTPPVVRYTITFEDNGADNPTHLNELVPSEEVASGEKIPKPNAIYKGTDTFGGWYLDATCTTTLWDFSLDTVDETDDISGNGDNDNRFTLYAKWVPTPPVKYTVKFDAQGGDYIDLINDPDNDDYPDNPPDQIVLENVTASEPGLVEYPVGDGYYAYFAGWYTNPNVTADDTFEVSDRWDFDTDLVDEAADLLDGDGTNNTIKLYAGWNYDGHKVIFKPNGDFDHNDSISSDEIDFTKTTYEPRTEYIAEGVTVSQPKGFGLKPDDPLAGKYAFTGWYTDVDGDGILDEDGNGILENTEATPWNFTTVPAADITLYAGWGTRTTDGVITPENGGIPIPAYTIMFNDYDDDADTSVLNEVVVTGSTVPMPDAIYRKGYVFTGWYRERACTTLWDFTTTVTEAHDTFNGGADDNSFTLHAGWELEPYTELWFESNFIVGNPPRTVTSNKWYSFQCDSGSDDYGFVGGGEGADYTTNMRNEETVIDYLLNHPNWTALIVGYADPATPSADRAKLITDREATTWHQLYDNTGVKDTQLVMHTKPPANHSMITDAMIIGPNVSEDPAMSEGDEIQVYLYIPIN